jgi:CYTH domain-containing protein
MGVEIERKFLVKEFPKDECSEGRRYIQGYLTEKAGGNVVRIRVDTSSSAPPILCIKGQGLVSRPEFEFEIRLSEAMDLLKLCGDRVIDKTRYTIKSPSGHTWEIDEFHDKNSPLIIAEVELESEDEIAQGPSWIGEEVTKNMFYTNAYLSIEPYSKWEHK